MEKVQEHKEPDSSPASISKERWPFRAGKKDERGIKVIHLVDEEWVIRELPGVRCENVQYYDLKNIGFINNTGLAKLIELLRSLLKNDMQVQFVNVSVQIRQRIGAMGLQHILNCG